MRISIRVQPGSRVPAVGGAHDGSLVVRVRERAVEGKATAAALTALAAALAVRTREVSLVSGHTSRTKLVEIPDSAADRFAALLHAPS